LRRDWRRRKLSKRLGNRPSAKNWNVLRGNVSRKNGWKLSAKSKSGWRKRRGSAMKLHALNASGLLN